MEISIRDISRMNGDPERVTRALEIDKITKLGMNVYYYV